MTETVTYTTQYTLERFAELIGTEATVEAVRGAVENQPSEDYGVESGEGLLDDVIEHGFDGASDRSWEISVGDEPS